MKRLIAMLREQWQTIDVQVDELEAEPRAVVEKDDECARLASIPGIGAITASAIVAAIGDGRMFPGRDFAAWLGLVPKQHSTGGRSTPPGHQQARQHLSPHPPHSRLAMHAPLLE